MSRKKYGMHLGLSGPFDFVYLQYSSPVRKMHSPSARTSSPTTRTAISTLGLKRPTLRPSTQYTIFSEELYIVLCSNYFYIRLYKALPKNIYFGSAVNLNLRLKNSLAR